MKKAIPAVIEAVKNKDTGALNTFKTEGVSLARASAAVVKSVVAVVKEGKTEEAEATWSALSDLGADINGVDEKGQTVLATIAQEGGDAPPPTPDDVSWPPT